MQYLLALTYFVFIEFLSLLSTKVGAHVTAVVLRGQSLKMVKPRSDARVFSFLLTSCFDKKKNF